MVAGADVVGMEVVLTGTGEPEPSARRAGPGVLVRAGDVALQFDAGRATSMRLAEAGAGDALTALFLTHHHSDHLMGFDDLVLSRWIAGPDAAPLPVVAPAGPCVRFAERVAARWEDDVEARRAHAGIASRPAVAVAPFDAVDGAEPQEVWAFGGVTVRAVAVHHEPVVPAVGYRVDGPHGAVVVSGDTVACDEVEALAAGADVLVHEALCAPLVAGDGDYDGIAGYHADARAVGELARRSGVRVLVLTHLLPAPAGAGDEEAFAAEVRRGGFSGEVVVGRDLDRIAVAADGRTRIRRQREIT